MARDEVLRPLRAQGVHLGYKADVIKQFFLNYEEWISNDFTLSGGGKHLELENNDIADWHITFVDTGLHSNIGQRLVAVKKYVDNDEIFLANYSDGLTDLHLPNMIDQFAKGDKVASFMAVPPSQSFHLVDMDTDGSVQSIRPVTESSILINGGYFVLRREIFDYIRPGEELVVEPFRRLIDERKLVAYRYDRFWVMDTFNSGRGAWELWKGNGQEH